MINQYGMSLVIYNQLMNQIIAEQEHINPTPQPTESQKRVMQLDEPVIDTIMRDLTNIGVKLKYAMLPSLRQTAHKQLRQWDLWGPLVLCLLLCFTLSVRTEGQSKSIITSIFVIMWAGSFVVFVNANFLGSQMTFFQAASLLGYCVFPINAASLAMVFIQSWIPSIFKLGIVAASFLWASMSSIAFVGEMIPPRKRKLALYPIILFYLFLSWFVLVV